jgi:hypothetical protein
VNLKRGLILVLAAVSGHFSRRPFVMRLNLRESASLIAAIATDTMEVTIRMRLTDSQVVMVV